MANKGRLIDALYAEAIKREVFVRDLTPRQVADVTRAWKKDPNRVIDEHPEPQVPADEPGDAGDTAADEQPGEGEGQPTAPDED